MKKIKSLFLLLFVLLFFQSCATIKEGFSSQKKKSTDEFLVEKKSPLVMPPDYDKLPMPKPENVQNLEKTNVESLISNNTENKDLSKDDKKQSNTTTENSILEKIKSN